jgi:hypothetical protein
VKSSYRDLLESREHARQTQSITGSRLPFIVTRRTPPQGCGSFEPVIPVEAHVVTLF